MSSANFNSKDFYENLGIPRDADISQIKKAYKKLSLKHHPDKNPDNKEQAEEIFKIISYAYQVLSDEEKRRGYDQYGRDFIEGGGNQKSQSHSFGGRGFGGHQFNMKNADDIFKEFFGGRDPFAGFFDDEDDFFGGGFGHPGFGMMGGMRQQNNGVKKQQKNRNDPFAQFGMGFDDDDFFGGGFGGGMMGGGHFQAFSSNSFGGMGGGMGTSISQQTVIENGRQKKITRKVTTDQHGNQQTEVTEEYQDPRTGEHFKNKYVENGQLGYDGGQRGGMKQLQSSKPGKTSKRK